MKNVSFKDFRDFKVTAVKSLNLSSSFKIVCRGEYEEKLALNYGSKVTSGQDDLTVIEGRVDEKLTELFKNLQKPDKPDKLMPFYALILDDKIYFVNYAMEHYIK